MYDGVKIHVLNFLVLGSLKVNGETGLSNRWNEGVPAGFSGMAGPGGR